MKNIYIISVWIIILTIWLFAIYFFFVRNTVHNSIAPVPRVLTGSNIHFGWNNIPNSYSGTRWEK